MLLAWTLKTNPDQESYEKIQLNVNKPKGGVYYYTVQYNIYIQYEYMYRYNIYIIIYIYIQIIQYNE